MAGIRKHGEHRYSLSTAATAAGTAANPAGFTYDAYPNGSTIANTGLTYDSTIETVTELILSLGTTLTGQATNFTTFRMTHFNSAGSVVDRISVSYSAAGVTSTAFTPINFSVGSGATVPGAGTGTLTLTTGSVLPWVLTPGDCIVLDTTVGGTGQYTGGIFATFTVQARGA